MKRRDVFVAMAAAPLLLGQSSAVAGGFGVAYLLGELPEAQAGKTFPLRFVVLGHDMIEHLWNGFDCEILATHAETGETTSFHVPGKTGGGSMSVGGYSTEITLPLAGDYRLSIRPSPWEATELGTFTVLESVS